MTFIGSLRLLALFFLLGLPIWANGQLLPDPLDKQDQRRAAIGRAKVAVLAQRITIGKDSSADKVAAIYHWVTKNIRYDRRSDRKGRLLSTDPYYSLRRKKALSGGYAVLMERLCLQVGIPAVTIDGHLKGLDFRLGQRFNRGEDAWNAVMIGGQWQLLDASWGSCPTVFRRQALRAFVYRKFGIPFARRVKTVHHPNDDWLLVAPAEMAVTHLPIAPYWQLQDTTITLEAFEATRDTNILGVPVDFISGVAASAGAELPQRVWLDGEAGLLNNPRDQFDVAYGNVLLGQKSLAETPKRGGDTLTWHQGIEKMKLARTYLVEWKRTIGAEQQQRMSELSKLERKAARAISLARGEIRLVDADYRKLPAFKNRIDGIVQKETYWINQAEDKIRSLGDPPEKKPEPIKKHVQEKLMAKFRAAAEASIKLADTLVLICRGHHVEMARIYAVGDSIERTRREIAVRVDEALPILMANSEQPYLWACDTLERVASGTRLNRRSRIRQNSRFWANWRGNTGQSLKIMGQFKAMHSIVRNLYLKGLPEDSAVAMLAEVNFRFDFWKQKRIIQLNIPYMQCDLEVDHITTSQRILNATATQNGYHERLLGRYLKLERKRQNLVFHREMRLANHLEKRAQAGTVTMRRWISEARAQANQIARR